MLKRELYILLVPALFVIGIGLFPNLVFNFTQTAAESWLHRFHPEPAQ